MKKTRNRQSSVVVTLLSLFLSLLGWIVLAPTQLGGSVSYVIVNGNSMEPDFHLGDLLLVRAESSYQAGDAVTYQNEQLGKLVFHRIIGTELDRFVLKGDNNSWVDSYRPSQNEIVGKLWVYVPKLGKAIEWLRAPLHMALTVGLLGGILMSGMIIKPPEDKKRENKAPKIFNGALEGAVYLLGFLTLTFLAIGIVSFVRPLMRTADDIKYQQEGVFSYSAVGTPGVYDSELVRSGEPVFQKLTCFLNVGFTYYLIGPQTQEIAGNYQLYARVLDEQSGWQRTIPLTPTTTFNGNTFSIAAPVDLCQVVSLVNLVEEETGLHPGLYTLEIVNQTAFTALVAGEPVNDTFDASLFFKFDKAHFFLDANDIETDPLHISKESMVGSSDLQANTFSIFGLQPTVWNIRLLSLIGFTLSFAGLLIVGLNIYYMSQQSPESLIKLRYGSILVDVYKSGLEPASTLIDVASMEDLAKLADRQGTMILHMTLNFLHYYLVQNNGTTYRYVMSAGKKGVIESDSEWHEPINTAVDAEQTDPPRAKPISFTTPRRRMTVAKKNRATRGSIQNDFQEPSINHYKSKHVEQKQQFLNDQVEYVIHTGAIACTLTRPETEMLKRIGL